MRPAAATVSSREYFVPGAGADELILLAARAFLSSGSRSAAATPTYPLYRIACAQVGIELDEVPTRGPDFALDEDSLVAAARDADLLWLCLPNNPTGAELDSTAVDAVIAATDGVVVIDAAYAEFVGADWAPWVDRYSNLIVLHTLSKAYGLAAARVGYAMAHPSLIDRFDALRPPGSIATVSAALGVHALDHPDLAAHVVAGVAESRSGLAAGLSELGMRVVASRVNFLLCEVGPNAVDLAARLRARGLIARTFNSASPLQNYLRFTVRSPDENGVLLAALREEMS